MITKTKTQMGTLFVLTFLLSFSAQANPVAPAPDSESPSINLLGGNPLEIYKGSVFVDPGATVTDNVDAAKTVFGVGTVDTTIVGIYELTYTETDAAGNMAVPLTRTVNVVLDPAADEDGDGLSNGTEISGGTNPYQKDSDGDGVNDPVEIADGTNPNDPSSYNILNKGLVAYYPFNGNANDESGNKRNASVIGANLTQDIAGLANSAYSFDGTSSYMTAAEIPVPTSNAFTWSIWLKPTSAKDTQVILSRAEAIGQNSVTPHLSFQPGRKMQFVTYNDSTILSPSNAYSTDHWVHVVITSASNGSRLMYLDGQSVATATSAGYGDAFSLLMIGKERFLDPSVAFQGTMDNIRMYDRPLSSTEVSALYVAEAGNLDSDGDGLTDAWERGYGRYQIIPGSFTATQAKADAVQRGGAMATFTSSDEWQSYLAIYGPITTKVRIGLEASNTDPTGWAWVTGEVGTFRNWDAGQPGGGWGTGETTTVVYDKDSNPLNIWHDFPDDWGLGNFSYILEFGYPTDPTKADTDGDGFDDKVESLAGTDPNDPSAYPDPQSPLITLIGDNPMDIFKGSAFTDPGATVTDNKDATRSITGSGTVDTSAVGIYTLTYTATDGAGNLALPVTRTVNVVLDPAADEDGDGLGNAQELTLGTSPYQKDTDNDGVNDPVEIADGTNPNSASSYNNMSKGLVAYYPFNGNANDESGNGNHGTVTGAILASSLIGKTASAYWFDGINSRIVTKNAFTFGSAFTASTWIKPESVAAWGTILDCRTGVNAGLGLEINNAASFTTANGSSYSLLYSSSSLATGSWVHVVAVYDGSQKQVFINGKLSATADYATALLPSAEPFVIGDRGATTPVANSKFCGTIDDVRLYNRALSASDVDQLYQYEAPPLEDSEPPVITLVGENPLEVYKGSAFTDPGAMVTDNVDTTRSITGGETVNTEAVGIYTMTYTATDAAGNMAVPVTRTVNVVLDPAADEDGDGLSNAQELALGTSPYQKDTDTDGVNDPVEVVDGTNPNDASSYNSLSRGLLVHYTFDGNLKNLVGDSSTDLVCSGPQPTQDRFNRAAGAYDFRGNGWSSEGGFMKTKGSFNLSGNIPRTISAWIYRRNMKPGAIVKWGSPDAGFGRMTDLFIESNGIVLAGGFYADKKSYEPLILDQWVHLVATYVDSVNSIKIYVNGVEIPTYVSEQGANTWNTPSGYPLFVGSETESNGATIDANLDDVRIYNRALSANEVGQLYQQEAGSLDSDGDGLTDAWERGFGRYQIVSGNFTWDQAKVDAEARGGHLATITSQAEYESMKRILGLENSSNVYWLGGNDIRQNEVWEWVTGEAWNFNMWRAGEPNDFFGYHSENAIELYPDDTWCDVPEASDVWRRSYILEYGYPTDPSNPDTDGDGFDDKTESLAGEDPNNPEIHPLGPNPVISLLGANPIEIYKGTPFIDPGAAVVDDKDSGLSVVVSGTVNSGVVGSYTLTYSATDSDGNVGTPVTRTVNVVLDPNADEDGDGIPNATELTYGTDPTKPDTDGDGLNDGYEMGYGRYELVTGSFTWDQARLDAEARGGHLLTVSNAQEWQMVQDRLGAAMPNENYWLGGADNIQEGTWVWVTGEKWTFAPWAKNLTLNYNPYLNPLGGFVIFSNGGIFLSTGTTVNGNITLNGNTINFESGTVQNGGLLVNGNITIVDTALTISAGTIQQGGNLTGATLGSSTGLVTLTGGAALSVNLSLSGSGWNLYENILIVNPYSDEPNGWLNENYLGGKLSTTITGSARGWGDFGNITLGSYILEKGAFSNPLLADTDEDGILDGAEISAESDPNNDQDTPALRATPYAGLDVPVEPSFWTFGGPRWTTRVNPFSSHDHLDTAVSRSADGQTSWMERTVQGPAYVSFWWRGSSEAYYDFYSYTVDGVVQERCSGERGWQKVSLTLAAGSHTVRWSYEKDESEASGEDAVFVDELSVIAAYADLKVSQGGGPVISPWNMDFGSVLEGSAFVDRILTLTNEGNLGIEIELSLLPNCGFQLLNAPTYLDPNQSVDVAVRMLTSSPGLKSTFLSIIAPGSATPAPLIELKGVILAKIPIMELTQGGAPVISGSTYPLGNLPQEIIFTIRNLGTDTLRPVLAVLSGEVAVVASSATEVAPGESGTLILYFAPTTTGAKTAEVSLLTNDLNHPDTRILLSGTSILPNSGAMGVTLGQTGGGTGWQVGSGGELTVAGGANNSQSYLEATYQGPGLLSWSWKSQVQQGNDAVSCTVNGIEVAGISKKNSSWEQQLTALPGGVCTVRWSYLKDGITWTGSDVAWLSTVQYRMFSGVSQTLEQWLASHGLLSGEMPIHSAKGELPAVLAYLGGVDPLQGAPAGEYHPILGNGQMKYCFGISKHVAGAVIERAMYTQNLTSWSTRGYTKRIISENDDRIVVEVSVPTDSSGGFLRLEAVSVPAAPAP